MKSSWIAGACFLLLSLMWGCSIYELEGMALESSAVIVVVGDTASVRVISRDGSNPSASEVEWASSDPGVATVDELGVITATGPGRVQIQARTGDYRLEISLLVLGTAGPFATLATGVSHTCALGEDGRAWCWGSNEEGQVGTRRAPDRCYFTSRDFLLCAAAAIPVETELRFTQLVAGFYHTCGLATDGSAHCWGLNDRGQLGNGGTTTWPTPVPVSGAHTFAALTAGGRTTCGLTEEHALLCWGSVLGAAPEADDVVTSPVRVAEEHGFTLAVTSGSHTCGVTLGGATYCWGDNRAGQLGVESIESACDAYPCTSVPQAVTPAPPFVDLALGGTFSCGMAADGSAHCWGGNDHGQLGDGTGTDRWQVLPVAGGHTYRDLDASNDRVCGVDVEGLLHCWGRDPAGFGNGDDLVEVNEPVPAASGLTFTALSVGFDTFCGVAPTGVSWCWGANMDGALGNGITDRFAPVSTPQRVVRHPDR